MMNKNIDNELQELIDENDHLLEENNRLKDEILALKSSSNIDTSLEEYYANKYLKLHEDVKKEREKEIEKRIASYENTKAKLLDQELNFGKILDQNEEFNIRNKTIEKEEQELSTKSYDLNKKLSSTAEYYDTKIKLSIDPLMNKYNELLKALYEHKNISGLYASIITDIRISYPLAGELRNLAIKKAEDINKIEAEIEKTKKEKETLKIQKDNLINDVQNNFDLEIKRLSVHYNNTIELENKLKQELNETLDVLKEQNVKEIINQVNYYKLTNESSINTSELMDKLINKKIEELKSQESFATLKANKEIRLADINLELERLDAINERLEKLQSKENYLYNIYITSANTIDEIVDFLDQATLAIGENGRYSDVVKNYLDAKERYEAYQNEYDKLNNQFSELSLEKQEKMMCAFSEEEIKIITSKLAEVNSERFKIKGLLDDAKYEVTETEKNYENLKLLAVLKEKEYAEANLPSMYKTLRNLKFKLNDLKIKEHELEALLHNYNALKLEKERLMDEINN